MKNPKFVFFGTSEFSVFVLEGLFSMDVSPSLIVTYPDKAQGRKLLLKPNPVKSWAIKNNISFIELTNFKDESFLNKLKNEKADVFIVASFGKIIPAEVIYMPPFKTLNVHPSLLPRLRGASPIQTAILSEEKTGVTIMRLDEKMDEGPIIAKKEIPFQTWPDQYRKIENILGFEGGVLLSSILDKWTKGEILEIAQDHNKATYTKKISKNDADITNDKPEIALKKIYAFEIWPRARIGDLIITKAHIENDSLIIDKVIPPGKNEINFKDYKKN